MKHLFLLIGLASFCLSSSAAAQSMADKFGGLSTQSFVEPNWWYQFDRASQNISFEAALRLAMKDARDGNAAAMTAVGLAYARGEGVQRDDAMAAAWLRKAAARGNATAMYALGLLYWHGTGVERDRTAARHWLVAAADGGERRARAALLEMSEQRSE